MTVAIHMPRLSPCASASGSLRSRILMAPLWAMLACGALAPGALAQEVSGPAWTLADEAYKAFARGDYAQAVDQAQKALSMRPEVVRWRLLLIDALEASGRLAEAEAAVQAAVAAGVTDPALAERAADIRQKLAAPKPAPAPPAPAPAPVPAPVAPVPPPAAPVAAAPPTAAQQAYAAADRGYKAYAAKDYPAAIAAARTAVAAEPSNAGYRLLLVNALSAANRLTEATQAAGEALARLPGNAELLAQRGYAFQRLGRATQASQDFSAALRTGRVSPQEARGLRLALADTALAAKTPEQALAALAPLARDTGYEVQARRGFALQALNRHDEALVAFDRAAASAPSAADRATMTRAGIGELVALGRKAEAKDRFLAALDAGDLRTLSDVDTAYLANQVGADPQAYAYFQKARAYGGLRGSALLDAGYVAKREVHTPEAVSLFKTAIDANREGELPLPPQTVFGLRREVADMERVWGAYASVSYGAVGVMPTSPLAPPPGVGNTVQAGTELYWRPPGIGYRNGALFEMFFRAFETIYDENDGATGVDTIQGSVGARWKPLSDQNLVLEVSYLFPIGDLARTDWLLRAAYSTGAGSDLRVDVPDWLYWQVYAEGDYFLLNPQTLGNFEARLGRSYRADPISDRIVFTPFLAIGGAYDSTLATPGALGAGPGANLRFWFREDRYTAPQSYVDLTLQYRWRLAGDQRAEGIFASAFLSY